MNQGEGKADASDGRDSDPHFRQHTGLYHMARMQRVEILRERPLGAPRHGVLRAVADGDNDYFVCVPMTA